jgi:tetrahydromethanopterin S-methyltransferase subunit E
MDNKLYILTETLTDLKEHMDLQTALAKTGGIVVFLTTYLFNFQTNIKPLFGSVIIIDEMIQGIIRLAFGIITALIIMIITDIYKYARDKVKIKIKIKDKPDEGTSK